MKKCKLSIFGPTGFIGKAFIKKYSDECLPIARWDRLPQSKDILYFISTTHNYNVLNSRHLDIDTNLKVLMDVLEKCKPGDTFNFVSSWFVYGNTQLPAGEYSECHPKGFYSITKRCAEQLVISYCDTFDINYRILRLASIYGAGDKPSLRKNALQYLINEMKENRDIKLYNDGDFTRDFMHIDDAVSAIKLVLDNAPVNDIINIGNGRPKFSFGTIIKMAHKLLKSKSKINNIEPPDFHKIVQVKDFSMSNTKLIQLGYKQQVSMGKGLLELCK